MTSQAILRLALFSAAIGFLCCGAQRIQAQDVGGDIGGNIFRPKNPEIKKKTTPPKPVTTNETPEARKRTTPRTTTPGTKPKNRASSGAARPSDGDVDERVDGFLEKGNRFRDARSFAEAEGAYKSALGLKP